MHCSITLASMSLSLISHSKTVAVQPFCFSSAKSSPTAALVLSVQVALLLMKIRLLAPRETIHLDVLRPIPPSPPGKIYDAFGENM